LTDTGFVEELMNGEQLTVDSTINNYSLGVGDVIVDVDKNESNVFEEMQVNNSSLSELYDEVQVNNSEVFETANVVNNAGVFESEAVVNNVNTVEESFVSDSRVLSDEMIVNNAGVTEIGNFGSSESFENSASYENYENYERYEQMIVNNSEAAGVYEEVQNVVDNSSVYYEGDSDSSVNASEEMNFSEVAVYNSSPVTLNFNAYNEIKTEGGGSAADVDGILAAFGEKLAEAVALAAEGVHL
jgi:hypothetical protein